MRIPFKSASVTALALAGSLTLSGCANSNALHHDGMPPISSFKTYPGDRELEPAAAARAEAIGKLMLAELVGQRGDDREAARLYTDVAMAYPSPELLSRATLINMFAGEHDQAVITARAWFAISGHDAGAIAALTGVLLRADRLDEALTSLDDWLETGTTPRAEVFSQIGQFLGHNIPPASALLFGQEVAEKYPDDVEAQLMQARLALALNAHELALPVTERAVMLAPEGRDAHQLRVIAASEAGDGALLIEALENALAVFPDDFRFRSALLQAYVRAGQAERAEEQLRLGLAENPDDPQMLRTAALLALQTDQFDDARRHLSRLADNAEYADEATLLLGRLEMEVENFEQARRLFEQVTGPEYWVEARIRHAESLQLEGRVEEAVAFLGDTYAETADLGDAQRLALMQGVLLIREGDYERAFDIYSEALVIWPESPDLRLQRALVAERLDRLDRLESDLRIILDRDPNHADALNALGYTLTDRTDRHDEALELIQRAVALDGNNPAYIDSLGWVYFRLGRHEEALEQLERAYRMMPDAEIGAHLGEVYWEVSNRERAREVWLESLDIDPEHQVLIDTLQRLAPEMLP